MARTGDNIHIPLNPDEALRLLMKVKPTKKMPRAGAHPSKPKRKAKKKASAKRAK